MIRLSQQQGRAGRSDKANMSMHLMRPCAGETNSLSFPAFVVGEKVVFKFLIVFSKIDTSGRQVVDSAKLVVLKIAEGGVPPVRSSVPPVPV